jgi:hypothetical protein
MPNKTGGKNYKKTKHSSEVKQFVERQDDQLYARVLQILGNRNVLSYCNDKLLPANDMIPYPLPEVLYIAPLPKTV